MNFLSICSGIEAASVAFGPLGWKAVGFSEIEPFPCAVLAHHYPDVPNLGDMSRYLDWPQEVFAQADAIVGGPPCQAFSTAGLRAGLNDGRGNLTLTFARLINHADAVRLQYGKPPVVILYENVPGLLSDKTNAFGCLLAALVAEDAPLEPPGGKWRNAGLVFGPQRAVAWRILDAQHFGLAQRRRRVFLVASAGDGFDPAAVLFESDGVRRDFAPSRQTRETTAHATAPCLTSSSRGVERPGDTRGQDPVITMAHGQGGAEIGIDRAPTLTCNHEAPIAAYQATTQFGDTAGTLTARHDYVKGEAGGQGGPECGVEPIAFHPSQDPISSTCGTSHGLGCGSSRGQASVAVAVALRGRDGGATAEMDEDYGADAGSLAPTLRAMGHAGSHANGGGQVAVAIRMAQTGSNGWGVNTEGTAYTLDSAQQAVAVTGGMFHTLRGEGFGASEDGTGRGTGAVAAGVALAIHENQRAEVTPNETAGTVKCAGGKPGQGYPAVLTSMAVRRLTPCECERLMGFPDGYTAIPYRGKSADQCPDGPRYKSLGNSWPVPVVAWIGARIQAQVAVSAQA